MGMQMSTMTYDQLRVLDEEVGVVHILSGKTAKDEDFYVYISIKPSRYEDLLLIASAGDTSMDLTEFGDILESGFGRVPSAAVMKEMEDKYGVDHNFIVNLAAEIKKVQD